MSAYLLQLLGMGRALVDACDAALLALTGGGSRRFRRGLGLVFALSSATVAATLAALLRRRYLLTAGVTTGAPPRHRFDFVVVGGGSAGCVLASRLSEDPKVSVLLLEAGQEETFEKSIAVPIAAIQLQKTPVDWAFQSEAHHATDGRVHVWPRGKVSLNWMLYVRGNPGDYDLWANEFGCTGWSYEEVLPYFRKSEHRVIEPWHTAATNDEKHRGADGPLVVSDVQAPNTITSTFIAAAQSVGIPYNPDLNGGQQLGVGHAQLTIDNGRRCTTAYAFLKPEVRKRPNLTVLVGAHATRVLFDIDRTRAVGIMQDHLFVPVAFSALKPVTMDKAVVENIGNLVRYLLFKKGPYTSQALESMAFIRTENCHLPDPIPDLQIHCLCSGLTGMEPEKVKAQFGLNIEDYETSQFGFSLLPTLLHPKSRGSVRLRSKDPFAPPRIHPNYLSEEDDVRLLMAGVRLVRQIVASSVFDGIRGREMYDKELLKRHPDPESDGYVHGLKSLRVADLSVCPEIISGNTNAPAIMIGEKASDIILHDTLISTADGQQQPATTTVVVAAARARHIAHL
ncbi:GMC family oxidoreductase [Acanthamoeba castellanii str. Neff]|uniref:GMC family oxidoreductase n=1 Tax=Acanthamoeba castellanii (strain ATCC 30010 / Neff) TaxID=1257118 RepID=L8GNK6_ACACF|nr:GMC family oxidoreductase [Acanthamoeba castellanii str. Neff]ELR13821.1 GMC family oxidoreductase [Acanthamoeba castellanii str. Neff]